jgi:DNA replication protein DnaC
MLERMRLPKSFWFSLFNEISDGEAKESIRSFLRKIDEALGKGYGLVIYGPNGVGKTSSAAVILKAARIRGYTGLFGTAAQFISDIMDKTIFNEVSTIAQRAREVDLLVIDDLCKEPSGQHKSGVLATERMIENLIRDRSGDLKSTIVTMNPNPNMALESRYGLSLTKLIGQNFIPIFLNGPCKRDEEQKKLQLFLETN